MLATHLTRGALGALGAGLVLLVLVVAPWADEASLLGVWETPEAKSNVEVYECGLALCGRLISLKEPLDDEGNEKLDRRNKDETMHARPIVGIELLTGFVADGPGTWSGGHIYNPEDGKTYKCKLTLQDDGTLKVRGFIGLSIFGQTQIWRRLR
ncbi:MAG: DUF2147 domain-containing protein [Planctomycetota bacterium]|nr:DUF2147 domain-containing protein [Planctomycetota bacterium]